MQNINFDSLLLRGSDIEDFAELIVRDIQRYRVTDSILPCETGSSTNAAEMPLKNIHVHTNSLGKMT